MVWKLAPTPHHEQQGSEWSAPISNELLDQVMRGKLRSTYQADYLGVPQGGFFFFVFFFCKFWQYFQISLIFFNFSGIVLSLFFFDSI